MLQMSEQQLGVRSASAAGARRYAAASPAPPAADARGGAGSDAALPGRPCRSARRRHPPGKVGLVGVLLAAIVAPASS